MLSSRNHPINHFQHRDEKGPRHSTNQPPLLMATIVTNLVMMVITCAKNAWASHYNQHACGEVGLGIPPSKYAAEK